MTAHTRSAFRGGIVACAGVFTVIAVIAYSSFNLGVLLALGSFGSSSVLLFAFPESVFSQPRSVVGGHFISSAAGLFFLYAIGPSWWSLAAAVAIATACMLISRSVHPPAGSNPIIVFLAAPQWSFLFFPTLVGALTLVIVAVIYHAACRRRYPIYWVSGKDPALSSAVPEKPGSRVGINIKTSGP
jgi:CBS-domain-containing membrane protein